MQGTDDANQLLEHYLTPAGMVEARADLCSRYEWFLHVSDVGLFDTIKKEGLKPNNPGCTPHSLATKYLGSKAHEILCLRPLSTFDMTPRRGTYRFVLAVGNEHLPDLIGLDWSYSGAWNLACIIKSDAPKMSDAQVFCEVVRRWGSVVSYDGIPASALRVRCNEMKEDDPAEWPDLTSVERENVHVF